MKQRILIILLAASDDLWGKAPAITPDDHHLA